MGGRGTGGRHDSGGFATRNHPWSTDGVLVGCGTKSCGVVFSWKLKIFVFIIGAVFRISDALVQLDYRLTSRFFPAFSFSVWVCLAHHPCTVSRYTYTVFRTTLYRLARHQSVRMENIMSGLFAHSHALDLQEGVLVGGELINGGLNRGSLPPRLPT